MIQRRFLNISSSKVKVGEAQGDALPPLEGVAVVYNSLSQELPLSGGRRFMERIAPGCFREYMASNPDVLCTMNHDTSKILGRRSTGTLMLADNGDGLSVRCTVPKTSYALDLIENIRRGDVQGMSFTFDDEDLVWHRPQRAGQLPVCEVRKAKLLEVCFTADPVYLATNAKLALREYRDSAPRELKNSKGFLTLEQRLRVIRSGVRI